jgi:hypothetical protein
VRPAVLSVSLFSCLVLLCGCVEQEIIGALTNPPVKSQGQIVVSMNSGAVLTVPGLASGKADPLVIEGTTSEMTFSMIAADESNGATAHAVLTEASRAVDLVMLTGGRSLIEVHRDGNGCVAQTGSVRLELDASKKLAGTFDVAGTVWGGSAPCTLQGTLDGVPLDAGR